MKFKSMMATAVTSKHRLFLRLDSEHSQTA
jgi:hypothetical protein